MEILVLMIGISLAIAVGFLGFFIWNMKSGQYEDTYTPSVRMLFEDPAKTRSRKSTKKVKNDVSEMTNNKDIGGV
jgi:cbb3-type cytochrome oxidase maturation protein